MQETQIQSLCQEDSPGEGNGNPRQYSRLGNPMDRGAWRATVLEAAKSQRRPERQQCSRDLCRERRALCLDRDAEGRGDLPCGKLLGNDGRGQGNLWGRRPNGSSVSKMMVRLRAARFSRRSHDFEDILGRELAHW